MHMLSVKYFADRTCSDIEPIRITQDTEQPHPEECAARIRGAIFRTCLMPNSIFALAVGCPVGARRRRAPTGTRPRPDERRCCQRRPVAAAVPDGTLPRCRHSSCRSMDEHPVDNVFSRRLVAWLGHGSAVPRQDAPPLPPWLSGDCTTGAHARCRYGARHRWRNVSGAWRCDQPATRRGVHPT